MAPRCVASRRAGSRGRRRSPSAGAGVPTPCGPVPTPLRPREGGVRSDASARPPEIRALVGWSVGWSDAAMATCSPRTAVWKLLLGALLVQCVAASSSPALRHARHLRRSRTVDETTRRIAQDIAVKVTNVSSVTQLYNLMVQYNKQYCDDSVFKELEKLSKSRQDEAALLSMKAHCRKFKQRHLARSLQRRETRGSMKIGSEAQEIEALVKKFQRTKTGCKPKNTLVEFPPSAESVYLPRCTNVKRCSGCCPNKLHVCRPVAGNIQTVKRKVVDIRVSTKDYKPIMKVKVMEVEQHNKCECGCKITVQCSPQHEYDEQNCNCRCRYSHEMKHCSFPRTWNSNNCKCECPPTSCSPGHHRDPETCKCIRSSSIINFTTKLKKRNKNTEKPG
ncbi:hypothetical protein R5R35_004813 [Gryllus longicercus]|uniref:Platelet-derived growth factor (PDGF) family profile domain-containing protein n=1 Tax=Gryllus longicercus TaxID=2509291 RepID=A0AAN9ZB47_9ORTH